MLGSWIEVILGVGMLAAGSAAMSEAAGTEFGELLDEFDEGEGAIATESSTTTPSSLDI